MKLKCYIDDGYVGTRPFIVNIPDDEIEECETEEEYKELIDNLVDQAFREKVTYYYDAPPFNPKTKTDE